MGIPIGRLQREITSREFSLYIAYYNVDPFGQKRADLRMAKICDAIFTAAGSKTSKPSLFMPKFGEAEEQQQPKTNNQMLNIFKGMAAKGMGVMAG